MSATPFIIGLIVFAFIAAFAIAYMVSERLARRIAAGQEDDRSLSD